MEPASWDGFANRLVFLPNGCWDWLGFKHPKGYVRIQTKEHGTKALHRLVYEMLIGPIPEGLHLDHLCRNRSCSNPDHLEPVTNRENVLRGIGPTAVNARKTHCPQGHEYTPDNVYMTSANRRICKTCHSFYVARYQARRKAEAAA